jgi:hypothetical protein
MLYWEFGSQTAVRMGQWKGIQPKADGPWELYDLSKDISETTSVAEAHSDVVDKMKAFAVASHEPVSAGTYSDPARTRHERDRWAKFGTSRAETDVPAKKMNRIVDKNLIPFDQMKLVRFSSENHANDRKAEYAIDGKLATVWHSQFTGKLAKPPHELVIDLGGNYDIQGFRYLARQDGGWNGALAETEFFVGDSPDSFGDQPAAKAIFKKDRKAQATDCESPVTGRYVKVRALSEVNGKDWASAAEIGVVGTPVRP